MRSARPLLVAGLLLTLAVGGCSATGASPGAQSSSTGSDDGAQQVVDRLGAVPIATPGPVDPTSTSSVGRPAVAAMGGPVRAALAGGAAVVVTALGPRQAVTAGPASRGAAVATSTPATLTLHLQVVSGSVRADAAELSSRDELGHVVPLSPVGPAAVTATPGHPADLVVRGTFAAGSGQVTWRHERHVVAVWTFTIELD